MVVNTPSSPSFINTLSPIIRMDNVLPLSISIAVLVLSYIVYQRFLSPLARVPGPFPASISRLWLFRKYRQLNMHHVEIDLHSKYGTVVRTSPNEVSISSPSAVKTIYGAGSRFYKAPWYAAVSAEHKEDWGLLGERDQNQFHRHRRIIGPVYALGAIKQLEHLMDSSISLFNQKMREMNGQRFDLVYWMNIFAIDMLTETMFSKRAGLMDKGSDDDNVEKLDNLWLSVHAMGLYPKFFLTIRWLLSQASKIGAVMPMSMPIFQYCLEQLQIRLAEGHPMQRPDLVNSLIEIHKEKPVEFHEKHLMAMTVTNLLAGFDTMSATLSSIIVRTVRTEGCQARLQDEIDIATKVGRLSETPTYDETVQLHYLQACMWEGARMHGVIGVTLPRVVPEKGVEIDGYFLPGGTIIGISPWVIHGDKSVYGDDADVFNPNRWVEASPQKRAEMDRHSLIFGGDSRACPGKNLAWVSMSKAVAAIFRDFEIELVESGKPIDERCFFVVKWRDVFVRFKPRR